VGCDKGRECENPAIADGVFAVALDRAHFIDYGEQTIAVNEKVPQITLQDFFAVLWIERTPLTQWLKDIKNNLRIH
jgi:hypothetical protein